MPHFFGKIRKNMYLFALENELPCFIMCVMVPFEIGRKIGHYE